MKNKNRHRLQFVFSVLAILMSILACNWEEREEITIAFEQYYLINSQSLLNDISRENPNTFIPVDVEPEFLPPSQQIPVGWDQMDYFIIIEAIFNNIWKDTTDNWKIKNMDFSADCDEPESGFQDATFMFFKNIKSSQKESRVVRFIYIQSRSNSVHVIEYEYFPRLVDWDSISLNQIQFSAHDALKLAESNGGEEARQSVNDECDIALLLNSSSATYRGMEWEIWYRQGEKRFFIININSSNGSVYFP